MSMGAIIIQSIWNKKDWKRDIINISEIGFEFKIR